MATLDGLGGSRKDVGTTERQEPRVVQRLTPMEAAHVYTVIGQSMNRLHLVGAITVDQEIQTQQMTQNVGEEISRMIAEQKELEKTFQNLIEQQQALRGVVNQSKLKENSREVKMVSDALRESTAKLCRNLKSTPNVVDNISKVMQQRLYLQDLFNRSHAQLIHTRRLMSVRDYVDDQEKSRREEEQRAIEQRHLSEVVKELKAVRAQEEAAHAEQMTQRRAQLTKEKERLKVVKVEYEKEAIYQRRSKLGANECHRNLQHAELEELQQQVFRLKQELKIEEQVHAQIMKFETAKSQQLRSLNNNWADAKTRDGAKLDKEMTNILTTHQRDLRQHLVVEQEYKKELALKRQRDELIVSRELAKRFEQPAVKARFERCTLLIQRVWRGYHIRRRLQQGVGDAVTKHVEDEAAARAEEAARLAAEEAEQAAYAGGYAAAGDEAGAAGGAEGADAAGAAAGDGSGAGESDAAAAQGAESGEGPEAAAAAEA